MSVSSSVKEESWSKISVCLLTVAWLRPTRGGWSKSPAPPSCVGEAWPVKQQQPQKAFEYLSSVCNVRVVILQTQYVGPVTSVSTAVHSGVLSGVLRYCVVLLSVFWFSSKYVQSCSMLMFLSVLSLILQDVLRQFACRTEASRWKVCLQPWGCACDRLLACCARTPKDHGRKVYKSSWKLFQQSKHF